MAKVTMIINIAMVVAWIVVVAPHIAEGLSCSVVVKSLSPCRTYLRQGGAIPSSCCSGAKSLNAAANTSAARKQACQCMKSIAKAYGVNPQYAAVVPKSCNVKIGYAISYTTNCNK